MSSEFLLGMFSYCLACERCRLMVLFSNTTPAGSGGALYAEFDSDDDSDDNIYYDPEYVAEDGAIAEQNSAWLAILLSHLELIAIGQSLGLMTSAHNRPSRKRYPIHVWAPFIPLPPVLRQLFPTKVRLCH